MEKIIEFAPAYDKRNPDPNNNYGIHGVNLRFVLKGEKGATQFLIFTNWQLPHVQEELEAKVNSGRNIAFILSPQPADVGYHSPSPQYEEQSLMTEACEYLGGKPCYYDGSGLRAEELFKKFVENGVDAVWAQLQEDYDDLFGETT